MKRLLILFALLTLASAAHATTYYVRTDGGTSAQCTGTTDAAYSGSGTACAFNSINWALPPGYAGDGVKPPVVVAGDTFTPPDSGN